MKVLMISGDKNIFTQGSDVRARLELQRAQVERLDVFVWPQIHSLRDISRAVKEIKYDVVTAQDPFWRGLLGWLAARCSGARLNIQVHTDLSAQPFARSLLARTVLRHADSIRVVSEKLKKQVAEMGARAPMQVLPVFVDVSRFHNLEHKARAQKTILWIGRFEDEKDPHTAISVLERVHEKGVDVRLIMLGSGSMEQDLRQRAHGLPVEFPGWQDVRPYLEIADAALVTSRHESWGASIIEALAAGVPVVSPDVGVAMEAGAIVVPKSELARAVVDVLQSGTRGVLKLTMPNSGEWAKRWKETLI